MKLGARFYIKKPYDPEELLDAIRRALEKDSDPS
jgi:FixJ family two-component response regulator